jgi:hypothetical protein
VATLTGHSLPPKKGPDHHRRHAAAAETGAGVSLTETPFAGRGSPEQAVNSFRDIRGRGGVWSRYGGFSRRPARASIPDTRGAESNIAGDSGRSGRGFRPASGARPRTPLTGGGGSWCHNIWRVAPTRAPRCRGSSLIRERVSGLTSS